MSTRTKIGEIRGYSMYYDPGSRRFSLEDSDGNEVATALTQDHLEEKAKKLSKKQHNLPLPVFSRSYQGTDIRRAQITSVNMDDGHGSVRLMCDGRRSKEHLPRSGSDYAYLFEVTPHNEEILSRVKELAKRRDEITGEIKETMAHLEKPITRAYFGLE